MFSRSCRRGTLAGVGAVSAVVALMCGMAGGTAALRAGGGAHPPRWRARLMGIPPVSARPPGVVLAGLAVTSPADAWGAGFVSADVSPVIDHWNGARWRRVTLPGRAARLLGGQSFLGVVSASSRQNVWMFTQTLSEAAAASSHGTWLRYDGSRWTGGKVSLPGSSFVSAALAVGDHAVWAFGAPAGHRVYAWYHDRGGWTRIGLPGPPVQVSAAAAVSATDLWALATTGENPGPAGSLLHLAGRRWHLIPLPRAMRPGGAISLAACGPDCALVGGSVPDHRGGTSPAIGRWNGRRWTLTTLPAPAGASSDEVTSLVTTGSGGLLAASNGTRRSPAPSRLWQYWHRRWTRVHLTAPRPITILDLAAIPRSTSVWAIIDSSNHFKIALLSRLP